MYISIGISIFLTIVDVHKIINFILNVHALNIIYFQVSFEIKRVHDSLQVPGNFQVPINFD